MTTGARRPGSHLRRFAERTFDRHTLDSVVLPAIADLQHERSDGLADSRLARLRAYWGVWKTLGFCVLLDWSRHSRTTVNGVAARLTIILPIVMFLITMPMLSDGFGDATYEQLKARGRPTTVSFGAGEWTFTELVRRARSETSQKDRSTARKMLSGRLTTSTLPIVLGFAALGISGYSRVHSVFLGTWVLILYLAALRAAAPSSYTPPAVLGVWVVNALFVLAGLCLVWLRPSPAGADRAPNGYVIS